MRRPARRLFTFCSAASLLLCVASCVLWVLSYRTAYTLDWFSEIEEPTTTTNPERRQERKTGQVGTGPFALKSDPSRFPFQEN